MEKIKEIFNRPRTKTQELAMRWLSILVASLLLGLLGASLSSLLFPKPKIGIIYIDAVISGQSMPYFTIPLNYASENDDIAAVVLMVNSPGGSASVSEELYFRTLDLRDKKPIVVSSRNINASGAYYMSIAANYIYAKPAALVGSIGVISGIPSPDALNEIRTTTGPFKGSGSTQVDWIRGVETIKNSFVTHVHDQRTYILENMHPESRAHLLRDRNHIATGQIWFAHDAYELGIIDAIGSDIDAIKKAADLAGVANYEIVDLTGLTLFGDGSFLFNANVATRASEFVDAEINLEQEGPWPSFYHLYIPPSD